jgi:hypothetical protein
MMMKKKKFDLAKENNLTKNDLIKNFLTSGLFEFSFSSSLSS